MQVYLLPFRWVDADVEYLLGKKNDFPKRIEGKPPKKGIPLNNAGNWVMSGGGMDDKDKGNITAAAVREFREETTIDYGQPNISVCWEFDGYAIVAVYDENIRWKAQQINQAIAADGPPDDELQTVAVFKYAEAMACFTNTEARGERNSALRKRSTKSRSWYIDGLRLLHGKLTSGNLIGGANNQSH